MLTRSGSKVRSKSQDAPGGEREMKRCLQKREVVRFWQIGILAWSEGVRGLLETEFEAVVVVGDEVSLFESARQLHVAMAVVDLSLRRGDGLGLIRRIRSHFPQLKLIALSVHEEKNAEFAAIEAGANGFVLKRSIATGSAPRHRRRACGKRNVTFPSGYVTSRLCAGLSPGKYPRVAAH